MPDLAAKTLSVFQTAGGARVFQIPLLAFPGLWGWAYVVRYDDPDLGPLRVLIDTGSGYGESNEHLRQGFEAISGELGEPFGFADLTHVLITHGHIDHFGGLNYVMPQTQAKLGVHELDRRTISNNPERLAVVARRMTEYLIEAGVSAERCQRLMEMYRGFKALFQSTPVDFTYEALGMALGPFEFTHLPGHCAGHVAIRLHDVVFVGDNVLAHISPHQAPERLTLSTGLGHYLATLDRLEEWAAPARLLLPGHGLALTGAELPARLQVIRSHHQARLQRALEFLRQPHTIAEVSHHLFREVRGYDVLLALEEAGAHVEYLYQRGLIEIDNLAELEASSGPTALRYQCFDCQL